MVARTPNHTKYSEFSWDLRKLQGPDMAGKELTKQLNEPGRNRSFYEPTKLTGDAQRCSPQRSQFFSSLRRMKRRRKRSFFSLRVHAAESGG